MEIDILLTYMPKINVVNNKDTSSSQQGYEYSQDYQSVNHGYVCESSNENETVEPFDCEKDALEFANFYSQKVLNEER
ncbi:MAG: hypothetical protein FWD28_08910 [Treponema sp.]|nr:hypothetical protein [Treponema sp.]